MTLSLPIGTGEGQVANHMMRSARRRYRFWARTQPGNHPPPIEFGWPACPGHPGRSINVEKVKICKRSPSSCLHRSGHVRAHLPGCALGYSVLWRHCPGTRLQPDGVGWISGRVPGAHVNRGLLSLSHVDLAMESLDRPEKTSVRGPKPAKIGAGSPPAEAFVATFQMKRKLHTAPYRIRLLFSSDSQSPLQ